MRSRSAARPLARRSPPRPLARAIAFLLAPPALAVAVALGGCGGSSPSGTSASPATVTPASVPLYIEAVVKPEGALKINATAAARRITGRQRPFEGLLKLLAGPTGKTPNYSKEVEPWLGPRAGVFLGGAALSRAQGLLGGETLDKLLSEGLTGLEAMALEKHGLVGALSASSAEGALVLDTSNPKAAKSFLEGQEHSAGAHAVSYRGVTFQVSPSGIAEGVVHDFAVIGSEAGMRAVIDTAAGGSALARASAYTKLTATAEQSALANAYLSPGALAHALAEAHGGTESILPLLEGLLDNPGQLYLSLIPSAQAVTLDLDTLPPESHAGTGEAGAALGEGGAGVLRSLPGSSWLALGVGDLARVLANNTRGLSALASLGSAVSFDGISLGKLLAPLTSHSIELRRDLLSWAGAAGVYVSGSSVVQLQGGLIIASRNPAASRAAVSQFAQAYREAGATVSPTSVPGTETAVTVHIVNFPLALTLAAGQGKFVAGLGTSSIREALSPQSTLGSSPLYGAAASALGQGIAPSALIEVRTLSGLLESIGLNQAPGISGFASAIAPLGLVTAGGGESLPNGVKRARAVFELPASASTESGSG